MVKTGTLFSLQRGSSSLHHVNVGIFLYLCWDDHSILYHISIYIPWTPTTVFPDPQKILPPWNRWGDRHTAAPALVVWAAGRGSGIAVAGSWESWDLGTAPRSLGLNVYGKCEKMMEPPSWDLSEHGKTAKFDGLSSYSLSSHGYFRGLQSFANDFSESGMISITDPRMSWSAKRLSADKYVLQCIIYNYI